VNKFGSEKGKKKKGIPEPSARPYMSGEEPPVEDAIWSGIYPRV